MKKNLITVPIILIFILISFVIVTNAGSNFINVNFGSDSLNGILFNNKTYVSIRDLAEKFNIPLKWDNETQEVTVLPELKQIDVSDKTEIKRDGVVPDEDTAYKIGKILLEQYMGQPAEYTTSDRVYFLGVKYLEKDNVWIVSQQFEYTNGSQWTYGDSVYVPTVIINKNTGEVIYINTYSSI